MILKEELHACPGCWFFTLKKWVFSCCKICSYYPNQFSDFFSLEDYYFQKHKNEDSLYDIQNKVIEVLPIRNNVLTISWEKTESFDLNYPILYCLNAKEYTEQKVYEFYTRHPFWVPLNNDSKLNTKELYDWYIDNLKESSLSELQRKGYISNQNNNCENTIVEIDTWEPLHMCPSCWFETLTWGLSSYDICTICFWEDDLWGVYNPCFGYGPNSESLLEVQAYVGKYISVETKEYHWYKRNTYWKPIDSEEIIDEEKPFIEKWFYEKILWDYKMDHDIAIFNEAQRYNPTKR